MCTHNNAVDKSEQKGVRRKPYRTPLIVRILLELNPTRAVARKCKKEVCKRQGHLPLANNIEESCVHRVEGSFKSRKTVIFDRRYTIGLSCRVITRLTESYPKPEWMERLARRSHNHRSEIQWLLCTRSETQQTRFSESPIDVAISSQLRSMPCEDTACNALSSRLRATLMLNGKLVSEVDRVSLMQIRKELERGPNHPVYFSTIHSQKLNSTISSPFQGCSAVMGSQVAQRLLFPKPSTAEKQLVISTKSQKTYNIITAFWVQTKCTTKEKALVSAGGNSDEMKLDTSLHKRKNQHIAGFQTASPSNNQYQKTSPNFRSSFWWTGYTSGSESSSMAREDDTPGKRLKHPDTGFILNGFEAKAPIMCINPMNPLQQSLNRALPEPDGVSRNQLLSDQFVEGVQPALGVRLRLARASGRLSVEHLVHLARELAEAPLAATRNQSTQFT
ncbi:hypothetical protein CLF_109465 [Clonorchis sinensis]|uniref:Uncharacterized protein n=1 Tax=Clonorchis sinensis TaxID=79923 RepID=G7YJD0_CLOSI|nr:hypothetical protein CLF_109465 [Clonorchis sinensis]